MCKLFILGCCFFILSIAQASVPLQCQTSKTRCVEKGGIKNIQGVDVTLDCWQYQTEKTCTVPLTSTCEPLRQNGCTQMGARCSTVLHNTCLVQTETFQCATRQCQSEKFKRVDRFCNDGKCIDHASTPSDDFDAAVSQLATIGEAGDDVNQHQSPQLFAGRAMECSDNMLGYKNCCRDSGWGKDINLAHCTDAEKALGEKREKGLSIFVGRYCHNRIDYGAGSVCTSHHQVYCVFDSRIAKAIQVQGRSAQLGIDFGVVGGDDSHPNCRAITAEELQQMDLGQVDFSSIYKDLENNVTIPNKNQTEKSIIERIQAFYAKEKAYE